MNNKKITNIGNQENLSYSKELDKKMMQEIKKELIKYFKDFDNESLQYHWAFKTAKRIIDKKPNKETYVIASGITPSGTVHIGNFREIITVDLVCKALQAMGKNVRFIYIWDDYDVFRKVPKNFPNQKLLKENLKKPLTSVPDVFGCHENYAQHNEDVVEKTLPEVMIFPEFIYQTKAYHSCIYAKEIQKSIENEGRIKEILNRFRTQNLSDEWHVATVYCEKCNKETTTIEYVEKYKIKYRCNHCGYENIIDFREKGNVKLRWRVDWPMRWSFYDVVFEPGGKDHSTVGGSYDTGKIIVKEIWQREPPEYLMYDFVTIKGTGGKISSSLGNVITLNDVLEIYTPELTRFLFAGTRPNTEIAISFDQDVIKIYEEFDHIERIYYGIEKVENEKKNSQLKIIYLLSVIFPSEKIPLQVSFRHLTTLVQLFNEEEIIKKYQDEIKDEYDLNRLKQRIACAKNWVEKYAPERFKFQITEIDEERKIKLKERIDDKMQEIIMEMLNKRNTLNSDELQQLIFEKCKEKKVDIKQFFKLNYLIVINKEFGPKLGRFLKDLSEEQIKKTYGKLFNIDNLI